MPSTTTPGSSFGVVVAVFRPGALRTLDGERWRRATTPTSIKVPPGAALLAHYKDTYGSDAIMLIYEADSVRNPEILRYIGNLQEDLGNERYVSG